MKRVVFDEVSKTFGGGAYVLDDVSLHIKPSELFGLVGPSGAGKTVALRILAGLETPTLGRIWIGSRNMAGVDPAARKCGLVNQQTQLMRHRTAAGNVRFPMEVGHDRVPSREVDDLLDQHVRSFRLGRLRDRRPHSLSGGEQRLVQLARAVAANPDTLLLDEPLANLDSDARRRMRAEIVRVHAEHGITTLYVTSDQAEAMSICDRIAVLIDGIVHQVGEPLDVYDRPATLAAARFFGEPAMNVVPALVDIDGPRRTLALFGHNFRVVHPILDAYHGRTVLIGIRPEDLVLGGGLDTGVTVKVVTTEALGHSSRFVGTTPAGTPINAVTAGRPPPVGTLIDLGFPANRFHIFDALSGTALAHPLTP